MKKKNKVRWGRLHTQLVLFYVILSLLVFSIVGGLSYAIAFKSVKTQAEQRLLQTFKQIEDNITVYLEDVETMARKLRIDNTIQDYYQFVDMNDASSIYLALELLEMLDETLNTYQNIHSTMLFREDGAYFGTTRSQTISGKKADLPVYSLDCYAMALRDFPNIIWASEPELYQLLRRLNTEQNQDKHFISALLGIQTFYEKRQSSVLSINLKEESLRAAYSRSWQDAEFKIDLVDKDGMIFSSQTPDKIGTQIEAAIVIPEREMYTQVNTSGTESTRQMIFYKIQKTGWYIAAEIPKDYFTRDLNFFSMILLISCFISLGIITPIYSYWITHTMHPLQKLTEEMENLGKGEFGRSVQKIPNNEIGTVILHFNEMSCNIRTLLERTEKFEREKTKIEIRALQNQINPHFLYNTLNTVKWMAAVIDAENIVECIVALNKILRPIFSSQEETHTVRQELDYLQNYVTILNFRYGNNISFKVDVDEALMEENIIRFILQPLVENAVTHGFMSNETGSIQIKARREGEKLIFLVQDSGVGISPACLTELRDKIEHNREDSGGIGLQNVNQRLRLHFGSEYGLTIESDPGHGTSIYVVMARIV